LKKKTVTGKNWLFC